MKSEDIAVLPQQLKGQERKHGFERLRLEARGEDPY
ncbi:hypothetical protein AGR7C_pTi0119 [Agrobacterium deltaense Zutra 3/1]|nr:hypothetical protein K4M20_00400 [Agrobacterium fabrum]CUX63341.1 hypothetical protein AGR7C_pTi0119 [Agrobacterium deltaense Zutra 3/1]